MFRVNFFCPICLDDFGDQTRYNFFSVQVEELNYDFRQFFEEHKPFWAENYETVFGISTINTKTYEQNFLILDSNEGTFIDVSAEKFENYIMEKIKEAD